jgi:hypothetical protein
MNNSLGDYENKLDLIITNIKNNNKIKKTYKNEDDLDIKKDIKNEEKKITTNENKDFYCKQLDSLNYSLEMYKVRKNKKADFDIHSTQKYNIEDEDIDKEEKILTWKDLSESLQQNLIKNFIGEISEKYNLDIEYTNLFINNNLNKIKYDKYKKKIIDLQGMINCVENNNNILKIKTNTVVKNVNSQVNKLRKALSTSKKSRFTVSS